MRGSCLRECLNYHGKVHKIFWCKEEFVREKYYGAIRERAREEERKGREPARHRVARKGERAHCIARPKYEHLKRVVRQRVNASK